jgi:hypothetical protein
MRLDAVGIVYIQHIKQQARATVSASSNVIVNALTKCQITKYPMIVMDVFFWLFIDLCGVRVGRLISDSEFCFSKKSNKEYNIQAVSYA